MVTQVTLQALWPIQPGQWVRIVCVPHAERSNLPILTCCQCGHSNPGAGVEGFLDFLICP